MMLWVLVEKLKDLSLTSQKLRCLAYIKTLFWIFCSFSHRFLLEWRDKKAWSYIAGCQQYRIHKVIVFAVGELQELLDCIIVVWSENDLVILKVHLPFHQPCDFVLDRFVWFDRHSLSCNMFFHNELECYRFHDHSCCIPLGIESSENFHCIFEVFFFLFKSYGLKNIPPTISESCDTHRKEVWSLFLWCCRIYSDLDLFKSFVSQAVHIILDHWSLDDMLTENIRNQQVVLSKRDWSESSPLSLKTRVFFVGVRDSLIELLSFSIGFNESIPHDLSCFIVDCKVDDQPWGIIFDMFLKSRNESVFIDHISEEDHLTRSSRSSDHFIQKKLKSAINLFSARAGLDRIYIIKDQEIRSEFSIWCSIVLSSRRSSERHRPDIALILSDEFVCPLDLFLTFPASAFWVVEVSEVIHEPQSSLRISDQGVCNIGQILLSTIYRLTVSHNVPTPLVCDAVVDIHLSNRGLGWSSESLDEYILALLKCGIDLLECWRSRKAEVFPEVVVAVFIKSRLKERSPEDFVLHSLQEQLSINQLLHPHHQLKVKKQAKPDQLPKEATLHSQSCSWSEWYCKALGAQSWPFSAVPSEQSRFILRLWSFSSLL